MASSSAQGSQNTQPNPGSTRRQPFSSQAFVPGPGSETFSQPITIPAVNIGTQLLPAGDWARYIKQMPWTVAFKDKRLKSDLLRSLVQLPNKNELIVRWGRRTRWTPSTMNEKIGARLANVEAALIQIVGTEGATACDPCLQEYGPFSHCVIAPGALECGNCHWDGKSSRCTLPPTPIPTPTPTTRRRTFSKEQRMQWEIKRAELHAEKARLVQCKAHLTKKIRDVREKVNLMQRVFTRLGAAGQTAEASTIYDEGWDKVTDVYDALDDLQKEQDAIMDAYEANEQEFANLLDVLFLSLGI